MLKQIQIVIAFLIISSSVLSKEYRFNAIGVEHGLSDPTIRSIYQDEVGRMWFATNDGLNAYDGNSVREFRQQTDGKITINTHRVTEITGNGNGYLYLRSPFNVIEFDLKTERMRIIFENNANTIFYNNGFLWIATQNLIHKYDTNRKRIVSTYSLPYPSLQINNISNDNENNLWIASINYGLIRLSINSHKALRLYGNTKGRKIFNDTDGNIWYTTQNDGVFQLNPETLKLINRYKHDPNNQQTIKSGFNRAITQDDKGNIWLGTNDGLTCIEYKTNRIFRFKSTPRANSLTSSSINCLYTDKRGVVWIGTYFGGVNYFNPSGQNYNYIVSDELNKLSYPAVGSFCEDRAGNVWVGSEGGGLYCYIPAKQDFSYYTTLNSGLSSNYIKKIILDPTEDVLWIAADNSGVINKLDIRTGKITNHKIILPESKSPGAIFSVAATNKTLFLGTDIGVVAFNKATQSSSFIYRQTGQFNATTNDMIIDSKNRLWFAVNNFPVAYSLKNSEFTYYTYNIIHSELESNGISNIFFEDKQGRIWLGTNGYGLLLLNENEKSFGYLPEFLQLRDRTIQAIAQTENNFLISTTQALYVYNQKTKSLNKKTFQNGFPLKSLIKRGLHVSANSDIYIGGIPTFVIYQENDLVAESKIDKIQLNTLIVNNNEVLPGDKTNILKNTLPFTDEIKLKPNQNFITLFYSTDNYFQSNDDRIEYRLKGYDQSWNQPNSGRAISYTNLAPGKYLFEIRSKDDNATLKALKIRVKSPFYATIWAYLFYLIVIAIIAYYVVREYHIRVKLKASLAYQEREKQQIEEMNQSKIRFFINVSHEIRTPITLVLAQTETLLNLPNLHSKTRNKIMNIHRHLLSLKHLVTELMDFRKQEQGQLKLKYSEIDMVSMLREHYNLFKGLAESKDIQFSFLTNIEKMPVWIDGEQMVKVINNLTINALKFTEAGGNVTISLEEKADTINICFKDTGIGIPADDLDKIFDRFYQANNTAGGGTGIGLSLSKGIVEAHGGTISVESTEGEGSTFVVSLPLGTAHIPAQQLVENKVLIEEQYQIPAEEELSEFIQEETGEIVPEERPVVLIVEDNDELRNLLKNTLSGIYKVETACDGVEGWEKVRSLNPSLVITDVMMPHMSGVDLCSRIKKNYELCHIPVILLTARQSAEYEIEGLRLGADSYLTKPFEIKKLIVVSNNLIHSRKLIQKKFEQNRKFDTKVPATNEFDKEFINKVTAVIQENLEDERFDVDILAREMGVSRTKLFGKIKTITGTTPNSLIQDMRLKKAADYLLNNPEMNVADISYQLCFNSPRYFNKCFKETFGVAPMHFKKENKK
jgi:signal transduction histidine kinase/ligand-binding sensor domain-containing protein/CheY-like chemotaxis protein